jgi:hypothetical protein
MILARCATVEQRADLMNFTFAHGPIPARATPVSSVPPSRPTLVEKVFIRTMPSLVGVLAGDNAGHATVIEPCELSSRLKSRPNTYRELAYIAFAFCVVFF